ncbi:MAG TPA: phosphoribosylformylglycinamidine synthase subunit PurS [Candidatus Binataceae bacterium]|jgi:phosphoribosylformylglycinamidine synthase|nr:phosphoribosylformylglycinamidine synthase subunit PurS [Candidatus Binataceae bacterium]
MQARIYVTPRKGILDPQGRAVEGALRSLGLAGVDRVHVGRYIVVEFDAPTRAAAEELVSKMCRELLANPNIEDYRYEVDP